MDEKIKNEAVEWEKARSKSKQDIKTAMHFIAQGAINISEMGDDAGASPEYSRGDAVVTPGCFIERDSAIHKAMVALCELLPPPREHVEVAFEGARIIDTINGGFCVKLGFGGGNVLATCKTRADAEAVVTCLNTLADFLAAD